MLDSDEENSREKLNLLKDEYSTHGTLQIKDYSNLQLNKGNDINFPLLRVTLNSGKDMMVKKSTLCWLLQTSGNLKLSNDRLLRVRGLKDISKCAVNTVPIKTKIKAKVRGKIRKIRGTNKTASESSSESADCSYDSSSSSDIEAIEEEFVPNDDEILGNNPLSNNVDLKLEHYYAVFYEENWFLGRIISLEDKIVMKFLKQELDKFIWPDKKNEDIQKVDGKYIFYGPIDLTGNDPFFLRRSDKYKIDKQFKALKKTF